MLTINDALELLDAPKPPPPRPRTEFSSQVYRHLDSVSQHLERAAAVSAETLLAQPPERQGHQHQQKHGAHRNGSRSAHQSKPEVGVPSAASHANRARRRRRAAVI